MKETSSGNRVFADVIKLGCGQRGLGWALNPMTGVLLRRERSGERQTHKKKEHHRMTIKAEIGMMLPSAKGYQGFLATTRSKEKVKKGSSLEPVEAARPH